MFDCRVVQGEQDYEKCGRQCKTECDAACSDCIGTCAGADPPITTTSRSCDTYCCAPCVSYIPCSYNACVGFAADPECPNWRVGDGSGGGGGGGGSGGGGRRPIRQGTNGGGGGGGGSGGMSKGKCYTKAKKSCKCDLRSRASRTRRCVRKVARKRCGLGKEERRKIVSRFLQSCQ